MAIDGRDLLRPKPEKDLYESTGIKVAAAALVIVPMVALVWLAYWVGTATGGVWGGVLSVVSTLLTVAVLWVLKRRRRR